MGEVRSSSSSSSGDEENDQAGIKLFGTTITLTSTEEGKKGITEDPEKTEKMIVACPRCKSMETKFCYFNNYNVNQPRHFCKTCQRYWTAGGALRNVPIGAGRRKGKPPCPDQSGGGGGSPDSGIYEIETTTSSSDDVHEFGLVFDKWHVATPQTDFRQLFSGKRRRTISAPQEGQ